jgi:hypothetical protein
MTDQEVGHYQAWCACQEEALKYLTAGAVLTASIVHSDRCGAGREHCDAGLSEAVA